MLCGVAKDFIGNPQDQGKKSKPGQQLSGDGIEMHDREHDNADHHHDHEKTGPAARMKRGIFPGVVDSQGFPCFEVEHGFMFCAVILEYPVHIVHSRNQQEKRYEHSDTENSINCAEQKRTLKSEARLNVAGDKERQNEKDDDIDGQCKHQVPRNQPGRYRRRL